MLAAAGFPAAARPEDAECLIVNTCAFIDRARQESVDTILELAQLKGRGACRSLDRHRLPHPALRRPTCSRRFPRSTEFSGPRSCTAWSTWCARRRAATTGRPRRRPATRTTPPRRACSPRRVPYAYVKIAEGCDMGCTFCAIPQFRGRHRSRPLGDVVREVEALGAPRHPGSRPRLPGHAGLRARPAGQRRHRRSAAGPRRDARAVDPADVSPPRPRHRSARGEVVTRAGGAVSRHAGPARRRRDPARHAPRRHRAPHA